MTDIEQEILNIIEETSECKYIGKLKVRHDDDGCWVLHLFMNRFESPMISLALQTDDYEEFKEFVRAEIKTRKLESSVFWRVEKIADPAYTIQC